MGRQIDSTPREMGTLGGYTAGPNALAGLLRLLQSGQCR